MTSVFVVNDISIKPKYILCISTVLTISAIGMMYIKSKQNINQELASEALYNKARARVKEIGDVNKVLLEAIQNKDKAMMRVIQCGKDVIYDLYCNIDLADDAIEAIKQNPEFIIKNMRIQHVFFFAVQYGIIELVNVLEKHPECYEGYYVWFDGYPYCLLVLAERFTRYYIAMLIPDKTAQSVNKSLKEFLKSMPKNKIKTITCDRCKEFSGYKEIEALFNTEIYFTAPYCAWQNGTIENINRQLRRYYPKSTNISMIDTDELKKNVDKINQQLRNTHTNTTRKTYKIPHNNNR